MHSCLKLNALNQVNGFNELLLTHQNSRLVREKRVVVNTVFKLILLVREAVNQRRVAFLLVTQERPLLFVFTSEIMKVRALNWLKINKIRSGRNYIYKISSST